MRQMERPPLFSYSFPVDTVDWGKFSLQKNDQTLERDEEEGNSAIVVDTFDHQILQARKLLLQLEGKLLLLDFSSGSLCEQKQVGKWHFPADLEDGPVASVLTGLTKLRSFQPVGGIIFSVEYGALLDDEKKTLARFRQFAFRSGTKSFGYGVTQYLRGYGAEHDELVTSLKKAGAASVQDVSHLYARLGLSSRQYTAKPPLLLQGNAPAKESAIEIIAAFLNVARENEAGIVADLDTEFLHDYRVSLRKVRSVLSLFKGVFEREQTDSLKAECAQLMRPTNRLRDLDVYLLEKENYFAMVPESAHAGLTALFAFLEEERQHALDEVRKTLKSKSYVKQRERLEKLFRKKKNLTDGKKSAVSSREFGSRLVYKRYGQVCRIASGINAQSRDDEVHQLRISCKKLRYLMEFFMPIFQGDEIKTLIKNLKKLQDTLGRFNDYSVQQEFLRQIALHELERFADRALPVSEAIGALTALLYRLQCKERQRVMQSFQRFDSEETRAIFQQLFSN